jgi:phenylalanyl-tRNA synthetase beta chain
VVAQTVNAGDILRAAQGADKALIVGADVFDVYQGPGIDADKKSVAVAVTLQPTEKTLTDTEIEAVSQKIVAEVARKTGAVLRG